MRDIGACFSYAQKSNNGIEKMKNKVMNIEKMKKAITIDLCDMSQLKVLNYEAMN